MTSYVGLDVSLAETSVCVLGGDGRVRFEGKVKTRPEDLIGCLRKYAGDAERVGMETGQTAGVLFRALKAAEVPILCLETRHAHRALSARTNKTDRNDARGLAELMRVGWYRAAGHGADDHGALFRPVRNNRTGDPGQAITPDGVYKLVRAYSGKLGFEIGAHALRATAATNALDHAADIAKVQEWLGHTNIATTRTYDHRRTRPEDSPTFKVSY